MAFVRVKRYGAQRYFALVECRREGPKVRQQSIAYLGEFPSVKLAVVELRLLVRRCETVATWCQQWAATEMAREMPGLRRTRLREARAFQRFADVNRARLERLQSLNPTLFASEEDPDYRSLRRKADGELDSDREAIWGCSTHPPRSPQPMGS